MLVISLLTFSVRDHRVGGLAGQAAAHVIDGEDAEAVGGERLQARHVECGPVVRYDDLAFQLPGARWVVVSEKHRSREQTPFVTLFGMKSYSKLITWFIQGHLPLKSNLRSHAFSLIVLIVFLNGMRPSLCRVPGFTAGVLGGTVYRFRRASHCHLAGKA